MSDRKKNGDGPSQDSPQTSARKLRERVSFFEKVWTGLEKPEQTAETGLDVGEIEKKLEEERKKHLQQAQLEHFTLKHTPTDSPKHGKDLREKPEQAHAIDVHEIEKKLDEERRKNIQHAQIEHYTLKSTFTDIENPEDIVLIEKKLEEERKKHISSAQLEHVTLRSTPLSSPKKVVIRDLSEGLERLDVSELEKRLEEEKKKNQTHAQLEHVQLRHTPKEIFHQKTGDNDTFEETYLRTVEEGDLSSGSKMVKFEKITVKKSIKEITVRTLGSRTPSEEHILEDSAYHSHGNGVSKSSSITSLTGRFPSEESLRRTPSKETVGKDDWDSASSSSKHTTSGSEWYNEYKTQSFLNSGTKLEFVRSKSQYDSHIAEIRGKYLFFFHFICGGVLQGDF